MFQDPSTSLRYAQDDDWIKSFGLKFSLKVFCKLAASNSSSSGRRPKAQPHRWPTMRNDARNGQPLDCLPKWMTTPG